MKPQSALILLAAGLLAAAPACTGLHPPSEPDNLSRGARPPAADVGIWPRFALDVDVEGSLKPGEPIHLTVRGRAHYATQDVHIRLVLPEVAAAERSGWELVIVPENGEVRPHLEIRKAFAAGEAFHERTTVIIPEPGYYSAIVTVLQKSDDQTHDRGYVVGTGAGRELWLWIDEDGGRITDRFDPTLFPEGTPTVAGPLGSPGKPPRLQYANDAVTCISPTGDLTVSTTVCAPQPDSSASNP